MTRIGWVFFALVGITGTLLTLLVHPAFAAVLPLGAVVATQLFHDPEGWPL